MSAPLPPPPSSSTFLQSLSQDVLETQNRISSVRDRLQQGGARRPPLAEVSTAAADKENTTDQPRPKANSGLFEDAASSSSNNNNSGDGPSDTELQAELSKTKALLAVTQMGLKAAEATSREILRRYEAEVGDLRRRERALQEEVEALCASCERQHAALLSAQGCVALLQYESEEHKVQQAMRDLECC